MIMPSLRFPRPVHIIMAGLLSLFPSVLPAAPSPTPTPPETIDEKLFKGMQWRQIGPFRGGRALTIEGVPGEPDTYYFGAVAGGVWKTIDGGANWKHHVRDRSLQVRRRRENVAERRVERQPPNWRAYC